MSGAEIDKLDRCADTPRGQAVDASGCPDKDKDGIYDNLDRIADIPVRGAGKLAARLIEHKEAAFFARRLTEIACNMPLETTRMDLVRRAPDVTALSAFFDRHNFGPMLRRQAERLALLTPAAAA